MIPQPIGWRIGTCAAMVGAHRFHFKHQRRLIQINRDVSHPCFTKFRVGHSDCCFLPIRFLHQPEDYNDPYAT